MFRNIGPLEILVIVLIILVIFGPQRIAGIGRSLGKALADFRKASKGEDEAEEGTGERPGTQGKA